MFLYKEMSTASFQFWGTSPSVIQQLYMYVKNGTDHSFVTKSISAVTWSPPGLLYLDAEVKAASVSSSVIDAINLCDPQSGFGILMFQCGGTSFDHCCQSSLESNGSEI